MKIRLHGTLEEIKEGIERLQKVFNIVSISEPYKDRGKIILYRVYIEVRT